MNLALDLAAALSVLHMWRLPYETRGCTNCKTFSCLILKLIVRNVTGYGEAYVELIPGLGTRKFSDKFSKGNNIK
jgi:hypothetical protein